MEESESITKDLRRVSVSPRLSSIPPRPKTSLSGRAFLNRFDILMRLNDETKKSPDVLFQNLLDAKYLTSEVNQNNSARTRAFFRGMVGESCHLLSEATLGIKCQSFYRKNPSDFQLFLELQVTNPLSEKVFMMAPRFFGGNSVVLSNPDEIDGNLEIPPREQINLSLCLQIGQIDLPLTLPPVLVFFAFSKSEFDELLEKKVSDFSAHKHVLPLPVNILRFMTFSESQDFSLVDTLNLIEETMISNNYLRLSDLKKIFPNLGKKRSALISSIFGVETVEATHPIRGPFGVSHHRLDFGPKLEFGQLLVFLLRFEDSNLLGEHFYYN